MLGLALASPSAHPPGTGCRKHLLDSSAVAVSPSVGCVSGPEAAQFPQPQGQRFFCGCLALTLDCARPFPRTHPVHFTHRVLPKCVPTDKALLCTELSHTLERRELEWALIFRDLAF